MSHDYDDFIDEATSHMTVDPGKIPQGLGLILVQQLEIKISNQRSGLMIKLLG